MKQSDKHHQRNRNQQSIVQIPLKQSKCKLNGIEQVRQKLQQKKHQMKQMWQKMNTQIQTEALAEQQFMKKYNQTHQSGRQKVVDLIPQQTKHTSTSSSQQQQIAYYKQRDNYNVQKQFCINVLTTAVFYPPSCSAYDLAYCKGNDKVYAYGGISCTTQLKQGLKQYFYQLEDGIWKQIKPVSLYTPMPRYGHTLTGTSDSLLLFGGVSQYKQKLKDRCFYPDVWSFNIHKNNWKVIQFSGPMIRNRKSHAACIYNKFYIIYGGLDDSEQVICDISWVNIEERKGRWRTKKMQGRFNHQMVVFHTPQGRDYLFVFGGRNSASDVIGQFLIYPIYISQGQLHFRQPTRMGQQLKPCQFPLMRTLQNGVLIMGGIDANNQAVSQCWYYSTQKQSLQQVKSGIQWNELRGAKCVSMNGRHVYILSGSNSKKYKAIKISLSLPCEEEYKYKI